ncbi:MAG: DUF11 domain-containing protein [Rhizobacter sp.]|nr:DUF11 domain-containing protein [Burkholderiales bacterium]
MNINAGAGNFITVTVSGTVSAAATGNLVNTATVTAGTGQTDPTPSNNSATDTDTPAPVTDLSISKTDGSTTYTAGNAISYAIVVGNAGPSNAVGASVADTVPAAITGVTTSCVASGTASCGTNVNPSGNSVALTGVNINAGAGNFITITVSGTVSAAATGNLVNTATVTAGTGQTDPTPSNNSATDTDTPAPVTDLAISKTDGSATYTAGAAISYAIVVSNAGPSNAVGASVADTVPAAITGVTSSCVATGTAVCGSNVNPTGNTVSFTGVNINAGAGNFVTITVSGTVNPGATGNLTNTATATAGTGQTDPTPGNNSATDTDTPAPVTDLSITKTNNLSVVYAGGNSVYTITVTNLGPSNVTGALLSDVMSRGLSMISVSCSDTPGKCASPPTVNQLVAGNFALPTLKLNETYQINVTTLVTAADGTVSNSANVAPPAGSTDPVIGNNTSSDIDTVIPVAIPVPFLGDWNLLLLAMLFGVVAVGHKRKVWIKARAS